MALRTFRLGSVIPFGALSVVACGSSKASPGTGGDAAASEASVDASDAGPACMPADLGSWTPPAYRHAQPAQPAACTTALIDDFYASCLGPTASASACDENWGSSTEDVTHATCEECLVTQSSSPMWGPLVNYETATAEHVVSVNVAGCIELLDPTRVPCAMSVQEADECEHQACDAACPELADFDACVMVADQGACAAFVQGATCQAAEADGGAAAACVSGMTFEDRFVAVAGVFCGGS